MCLKGFNPYITVADDVSPLYLLTPIILPKPKLIECDCLPTNILSHPKHISYVVGLIVCIVASYHRPKKVLREWLYNFRPLDYSRARKPACSKFALYGRRGVDMTHNFPLWVFILIKTGRGGRYQVRLRLLLLSPGRYYKNCVFLFIGILLLPLSLWRPKLPCQQMFGGHFLTTNGKASSCHGERAANLTTYREKTFFGNTLYLNILVWTLGQLNQFFLLLQQD